MSAPAPRRLVQDGYNAIAEAYLHHRLPDSADVKMLDSLIALIEPGCRVLDAGCGAGVPVTRRLSGTATAIGLDFSRSQVRLGRDSVPAAAFVCGDMTKLPFGPGSFGAVCSYYAIIHIPRERHAAVLDELYRVLQPGGVALLCMGATDLPDDREEYLGVEMYWSHFDAATNLALVAEAGFERLDHRIITDESDAGGSGHLFVLARKPG